MIAGSPGGKLLGCWEHCWGEVGCQDHLPHPPNPQPGPEHELPLRRRKLFKLSNGLPIIVIQCQQKCHHYQKGFPGATISMKKPFFKVLTGFFCLKYSNISPTIKTVKYWVYNVAKHLPPKRNFLQKILGFIIWPGSFGGIAAYCKSVKTSNNPFHLPVLLHTTYQQPQHQYYSVNIIPLRNTSHYPL